MRTLAKCLLLLGVIVTCVFALMSHPPAAIGVESDPTKHVIGLAALLVLAVVSYPQVKLSTIVLWLSAGSFLVEVLQGVPPFQRDPDIYDWFAGMLGVFAALLPVALFNRRRVRSTSPASQTSETPAGTAARPRSPLF